MSTPGWMSEYFVTCCAFFGVAVHRGVLLHAHLQRTAQVRRRDGALAIPDLAHARDGGFTNSAVVSAAWRPKTTKSKSEFAPKRYAPCTDALLDSPAA